MELDRLVVLLGDGVLRDLVCRLAFERYTPEALSMALGKSESEIMWRVHTLGEWGLVRTVAREPGETVIEAVRGDGENTLRRWTSKYCGQAGSCGVDSQYAADIEPVRFIQRSLTGVQPLRAAEIGCGPGRYSLLLLRTLPELNLLCGDVNEAMLGRSRALSPGQRHRQFLRRPDRRP